MMISLGERFILVAPYWNVNFNLTNRSVRVYGILVAPYWNVNIFYDLADKLLIDDISSTILECKL